MKYYSLIFVLSLSYFGCKKTEVNNTITIVTGKLTDRITKATVPNFKVDLYSQDTTFFKNPSANHDHYLFLSTKTDSNGNYAFKFEAKEDTLYRLRIGYDNSGYSPNTNFKIINNETQTKNYEVCLDTGAILNLNIKSKSNLPSDSVRLDVSYYQRCETVATLDTNSSSAQNLIRDKDKFTSIIFYVLVFSVGDNTEAIIHWNCYSKGKNILSLNKTVYPSKKTPTVIDLEF